MTREAQREVLRELSTSAVLVFVFVPVGRARRIRNRHQRLNAPPPFKMIVKEERSQIEQTNDASKRLRLTIEFAAAI